MSTGPNFKLTQKEKRIHSYSPDARRAAHKRAQSHVTQSQNHKEANHGAQACRQSPTPICRNGSLKWMQVHTNRAS